MIKPSFKRRLNILVLIILVPFIIIILFQGFNINYKVVSKNIEISWFSGVKIPIKDITEVKVLDKAPGMIRIMGMSIFNIRQGTYSVEGIGRVKLYVNDITRKLILIKTDKMTYGITPENTKEFVSLINLR